MVADRRHLASPNACSTESVVHQTVTSPHRACVRDAETAASSPVQAGGKKCSTYRRDVRFLVAKQQPLIRSMSRCCPSFFNAHGRVFREPMPDRWSIASREGEPAGHPALFVRSVRIAGSPQSLLRGSLSMLRSSRVDFYRET